MLRLLLISILSFFWLSVSSQISKGDVYISSTAGSDINDGSLRHPLKTIYSLLKKRNKDLIIHLKRGDIFFESVRGLVNCKIIPYGVGNEPVLCGFRILKDSKKWQQAGDNLWKIDLTDDSAFYGYRNETLKQYRLNNIGCIYIPTQDKIIGHMVNDINLLTTEGSFYTTDKCNEIDVSQKGIKYLYFYSKQSPVAYTNLCFSSGVGCVSNLLNCYLSNIAIIGFGTHGICQLQNCIVEDCRIDIIGGSIQFGKCPWVRYGNGIEFWISDKETGNSKISGCVISRTYDCGCTIQGAGKDKGNAVNIVFERNQYVRCRQAFEYFMHYNSSDDKYKNCSFHDNLAFMIGDNQFNSPEIRDANILSYEVQDREMQIYNNVFYGGNYYFGGRIPKGMKNNRVYIFNDQYIQNSYNKKELKLLTPQNDPYGLEYSQRTGDNSRIIVLKRDSKQDLKVRKKIQKKLRYKKIELYL